MIIVPLYHRNIKSLSTRKPSRTRPARSNLAQMLGLVRNDFGKQEKPGENKNERIMFYHYQSKTTDIHFNWAI